MSIFSDHKVGAISDWEFEQECRRMNREDRYEREHEFDDPYEDNEEIGRCENCVHCKEFQARKPVVGFRKWIDEKGYVHNNREKPHWNCLYGMWGNEYVLGNICELTHKQVMDDETCDDFQEVGE